MTLSEGLLEPKQQDAATRLFEYDETILIAAMGAGKTVICLTAIDELIKAGHLHKIIVAAPAKVLSTLVWPNEVAKWQHLRKLRILQLTGDPTQRTKALLSCEADIIMISLNNLNWLLDQDHECDGVIIDELSKAAGKQTSSLKNKRKADHLKWRVGLSGTPVAHDFQKLYGMCRIVDRGIALGTSKDRYLNEFFFSDYNGYNWTLRPNAERRILKRVETLVHIVPDTKAQELPVLYEHILRFDMPDTTRRAYDEMKEDLIAEDIEAANAAVQSGKLRQIASGFMYNEQGLTHTYDTARTDAVIKWIKKLEGSPGIIFYEFVEQHTQLQRHTPDNIMLAQINSMSHGIDGLQHKFSDVLFMQPIWSADSTEQAIGRVWRKGQTQPVHVTTLVCDDTLDDVVIARVEGRGEWMKLFLKHLEKK